MAQAGQTFTWACFLIGREIFAVEVSLEKQGVPAPNQTLSPGVQNWEEKSLSLRAVKTRGT